MLLNFSYRIDNILSLLLDTNCHMFHYRMLKCQLFLYTSSNGDMNEWNDRDHNRRLIYNLFMMMSSDGNIFRVTGPLWGGIHRSLVNPPHMGQWRGASMFYSICAWTNGWTNTRDATDLTHHHAHNDVTVMDPIVDEPALISAVNVCQQGYWPLSQSVSGHELWHHFMSLDRIHLTHLRREAHIKISKVNHHWFNWWIVTSRWQAIIWTDAGTVFIEPL